MTSSRRSLPDPVEDAARRYIEEMLDDLEYPDVHQEIVKELDELEMTGWDITEFTHQVYEKIVSARLIVKFP